MRNLSILLVFISSCMYRMISSQKTAPQRSELLRYRRNGDLIIGGMFAIHVSLVHLKSDGNPCGSYDIILYEAALGMMFAIESTNKNPMLLQNITLGFEIYDSCGNEFRCLESTFLFLSGMYKAVPNYDCHASSTAVALIAEWFLQNSEAIARILGLRHFPQLFHYLRHVHFTCENNEIFFNEEGFISENYYVHSLQRTDDGEDEFPIIGIYKPPDNIRLRPTMIRRITWNGGHKQPPRSVCSESCLPGFRKAIQPQKPACCYDCVLCAEGKIANQSDSTDCLTCPPEEWPNKRKNKCIQRSTEFLSYDEPLGIVLICFSVMGSLLSATIFIIFFRFSDTPIVKANNRHLSYLLLIMLQLCFLCSIIFIGKPNGLTCRLRQVVFGIAFVVSVSCVLAKTVMVVVAFNATKPNRKFRRLVGPQLSYTTVALCTLVQVIICVVWIIYSPPFLEENVKSQPGLIIIECNEGSTTAFWCMLGYMGLLAGICYVVSFLARNLPSSFNEASFISFSMAIFISVWLGFIPAYLSTKGKYMVAVEVFAITSSSAGLTACIFLPKCYIVIMRPERNTKAYLTGKVTQNS